MGRGQSESAGRWRDSQSLWGDGEGQSVCGEMGGQSESAGRWGGDSQSLQRDVKGQKGSAGRWGGAVSVCGDMGRDSQSLRGDGEGAVRGESGG